MNATDKRIIDMLKGEREGHQDGIVWNHEYFRYCAGSLRFIDPEKSAHYDEQSDWWGARESALFGVIDEKTYETIVGSDWYKDAVQNARESAHKHVKNVARAHLKSLSLWLE